MAEVTITRQCKDCKQTFSLSKQEADWYLDMKLVLPKRCPNCRLNNREKREAGLNLAKGQEGILPEAE